VRDGGVIAKSKPMQRGFNFPYQIGSDGDDPSMAEVSVCQNPKFSTQKEPVTTRANGEILP
jgi:hypothetical protein